MADAYMGYGDWLNLSAAIWCDGPKGTFIKLPGVNYLEWLELAHAGGYDETDRMLIDHETMGGG